MTVRVLELAATSPAEQVEALRAALDGGEPLLPVPDGEPGVAVRRAAAGRTPRPGTALLLPTSGSTGTPKLVELGADALRASAGATATRLGGRGPWWLTLPLTHVAGWQVVVRSVLAGHDPVGSPSGAEYASLVPTQLARMLDDSEGTAALQRLSAILVGGAATPAPLLGRAGDAGVRIVRTYGMTETSGGCVYDGVPLDGVDVDLGPDGRISLSGPVLALGYLGGDEIAAAGKHLTGDLGHWDVGRLVVTGRADDQIVTGGVNVTPSAVEAVVAALPGVRDVVVVGVPDEQWGQEVVAVIAADGDPPELDAVRAAVREQLGAPSAPRRLVVVDAVPLKGIGKPDRRAAFVLATSTRRDG